MAAPVILERLTRVTPLALSFWDRVAGATVGAGLSVTACPPDRPWEAVQASVNRTGIYLFHDLPGLREVEVGAGDAEFWNNPPASRAFVVEVQDVLRRFQPFRLTLVAPVRGMLAWAAVSGSPPEPASVPLFSAPTRPVPAGLASIRAELFDPIRRQPAAWAVLQVRLAGQVLARGFADVAGRVLLMFAYPEPDTTGHIPLTKQVWSLELRANYAPQAPIPPMPDLETTLTQPPATLWRDSARTLPLMGDALAFGRELILRSTDSVTHQPLAQLLIT
jgi:hypothetical protein